MQIAFCVTNLNIETFFNAFAQPLSFFIVMNDNKNGETLLYSPASVHTNDQPIAFVFSTHVKLFTRKVSHCE